MYVTNITAIYAIPQLSLWGSLSNPKSWGTDAIYTLVIASAVPKTYKHGAKNAWCLAEFFACKWSLHTNDYLQ